jgi:hypothetical protein
MASCLQKKHTTENYAAILHAIMPEVSRIVHNMDETRTTGILGLGPGMLRHTVGRDAGTGWQFWQK